MSADPGRPAGRCRGVDAAVAGSGGARATAGAAAGRRSAGGRSAVAVGVGRGLRGRGEGTLRLQHVRHRRLRFAGDGDHPVGAAHPVEFVEQLRVDHHGDGAVGHRAGRDRSGRRPGWTAGHRARSRPSRSSSRKTPPTPRCGRSTSGQTKFTGSGLLPVPAPIAGAGVLPGTPITVSSRCSSPIRASSGPPSKRDRAVDVDHQRVDARRARRPGPSASVIEVVKVNGDATPRPARSGGDRGELVLDLVRRLAGLGEFLPDVRRAAQRRAALEPVGQVGQRLRPGVGHGAGDRQGRWGRPR